MLSNRSISKNKFKSQTALFDPEMGPYQVLLLRVRVDFGAMAMQEYCTFPKVSGMEPHSYPEDSLGGGGLNPLLRCSWCILQPQPIGLFAHSCMFSNNE